MRLICGVFHLNGAGASEDLQRAMAAQMDVPRLRPSLRTWRAGPGGLAGIDFAAPAAPPAALPERGAAKIAADLRLDERMALAHRLGSDAAAAEDALLLAALERFGPAGLDLV